MDRYKELKELVKSFESDYRKFYMRGNKTAGVRLRKHMQALRDYAKSVRDEVQELNKENEINPDDFN